MLDLGLGFCKSDESHICIEIAKRLAHARSIHQLGYSATNVPRRLKGTTVNADLNTVQLIQPESMYRALTYDHGARVGNLLFVAGQVGRDADGELVGPFDPVPQARQAFDNLKTILETAGTDFSNVVSVRTYYIDGDEIEAITDVRREYFGEHRPPHTGLVISMLGSPEVRFEIEVIALIPDGDR